MYQKVAHILDEAKNTVYKAANSEMVRAYWEIGREIVEEEQKVKTGRLMGKK